MQKHLLDLVDTHIHTHMCWAAVYQPINRSALLPLSWEHFRWCMLPPAMAVSYALTPDMGVLIVQNNMKLLPREMCTGVQRPDLALGSWVSMAGLAALM